MDSAEWWMRWKRQSHGTRWNARCTQYCVRSRRTGSRRTAPRTAARHPRLQRRVRRPAEEDHRGWSVSSVVTCTRSVLTKKYGQVRAPVRAEDRLLGQPRKSRSSGTKIAEYAIRLSSDQSSPRNGRVAELAVDRHTRPAEQRRDQALARCRSRRAASTGEARARARRARSRRPAPDGAARDVRNRVQPRSSGRVSSSGKWKAEHAPEPDRAERDREHPALPARAESPVLAHARGPSAESAVVP